MKGCGYSEGRGEVRLKRAPRRRRARREASVPEAKARASSQRGRGPSVRGRRPESMMMTTTTFHPTEALRLEGNGHQLDLLLDQLEDARRALAALAILPDGEEKKEIDAGSSGGRTTDVGRVRLAHDARRCLKAAGPPKTASTTTATPPRHPRRPVRPFSARAL